MEDTLNIILMIVSGLIIILTLLQGGKSDGLSAAFTGSGDLNLFAVQKRKRTRKSHQSFDIALWYRVLCLVLALQVI